MLFSNELKYFLFALSDLLWLLLSISSVLVSHVLRKIESPNHNLTRDFILHDCIKRIRREFENGECIIDPTSGWSTKQSDEDKKKRRKRLLPITEVGGTGTWEDGVDRENLALIPPFENTKHRYPWICSLRYVISKVL